MWVDWKSLGSLAISIHADFLVVFARGFIGKVLMCCGGTFYVSG